MPEAISARSLKELIQFPFRNAGWRSRLLTGSLLALAGYLGPAVLGLLFAVCFLRVAGPGAWGDGFQGPAVLGLGALGLLVLAVLVIPGLLVSGYLLGILRQGVRGEEPGLEAWGDWGRLAADGLRVLLIGLTYLLPAILAYVAGYGLYFAGIATIGVASGAEQATGLAEAGTLLTLVGMTAMPVLLGLGLLLSMAGAALLWPALAHFARHDRVAAAFRVREWWPVLWANKAGYLVTWLVLLGLSGLLNLATVIVAYTGVLCCLVPFIWAPVSFYVNLVSSALLGQAYHDGAAMVAAGAGPPPAGLPVVRGMS